MTIEKMRLDLDAFCESHLMCSECALGGEKHKCGNGFDFTTLEGHHGYMTDEEICMAYMDALGKIQQPGTESDEPHIRDSGSRTEFSTGAVRDIQKGKGRCDLMPMDVVAECFALHVGGAMPTAQIFRNLSLFAESGDWKQLVYVLTEFCEDRQWNIATMLLEVSKHFEEGAEKYGENNWQKGLPAKCYINSGVRHYLKYLRGDKDEFHDRAFCWNIICACWTCKHRPELNDYAPGKLGFNPDDFIGEYEEEND